MQTSRRIAAALALAAITTASAALAASDHPHWTYEGHEGPEHWGELSKDFAACNGQHQSPVDLKGSSAGDNENIALSWKPFAPVVTNNGHTIQANAVDGNTTKFGDKTYKLLQMHFHHTSEHTIGGKSFPLEAHFVNKGDDGKLMVLGVMIAEGAANPEIAKLWAVAPDKPGEEKAKAPVDFAKLIPTKSKFFRYSGSLTTPPCSEIVDWVVYVDPITASKEQIATFAKLYPENNRPVQALHDRSVTLGR